MTGGREYPDRPWCAVGVVVRDRERVLLVRRARPPNVGTWSLPGGALELGEAVFDAARREVFEETGIVVVPREVVEVYDAVTRDDDGRVRFHYVVVEILAEPALGEPTPGDDAREARWFDLDELDRLTTPPDTVRVIRKALGDRS